MNVNGEVETPSFHSHSDADVNGMTASQLELAIAATRKRIAAATEEWLDELTVRRGLTLNVYSRQFLLIRKANYGLLIRAELSPHIHSEPGLPRPTHTVWSLLLGDIRQ